MLVTIHIFPFQAMSVIPFRKFIEGAVTVQIIPSELV